MLCREGVLVVLVVFLSVVVGGGLTGVLGGCLVGVCLVVGVFLGIDGRPGGGVELAGGLRERAEESFGSMVMGPLLRARWLC